MELEVQPSSQPSFTIPKESEREFILKFKTLPILWDKTHKDYLNKYKRNDALKKLLAIFIKIKSNATTHDVKKKINTLRSNYRRELRKIVQSRRLGAGPEEVYTPTSWTFHLLRFLDKFEKQEVFDDDGASNGGNAGEREHFECQEGYTSISSVDAIPPHHRSTTKVKTRLFGKQHSVIDRAFEYMSQPKATSNPIVLEWAETLNRLDPVQKLYAKKAINDILFEAELGNLNRDSVQINAYIHPSTSVSIFSPPQSSSNVSVTSPHSNSYKHSVSSPQSLSPSNNSHLQEMCD